MMLLISAHYAKIKEHLRLLESRREAWKRFSLSVLRSSQPSQHLGLKTSSLQNSETLQAYC
jgi:hypothetical protein